MPGLPASLQTALADRYRLERELGASWVVISGRTADQRFMLTQFSYASGNWSFPVRLTPSGIRIAGTGEDGAILVSSDGKRIVCNVTTSQPDAWMVELPKGSR
jgi:hypothetical protein